MAWSGAGSGTGDPRSFLYRVLNPLGASSEGIGPALAGAEDRCTPCPCPNRRGWTKESFDVTQAQEALRGVGMPLRYRVGAGPADVAAANARRSCLGLVAVIVVATIVGVALS